MRVRIASASFNVYILHANCLLIINKEIHMPGNDNQRGQIIHEFYCPLWLGG